MYRGILSHSPWHSLSDTLIIPITLIRVKDDQLIKVSLYGTAHVSRLPQVPSLKLALEGIVPPLVWFAWFFCPPVWSGKDTPHK